MMHKCQSLCINLLENYCYNLSFEVVLINLMKLINPMKPINMFLVMAASATVINKIAPTESL
jgi:hypothetical protein